MGTIILLSIFLFIIGHLFYILYKVDWSFSGLIKWHKKRLFLFLNEVVEKENKKNNLSPILNEELVKTKDKIKDELDISNIKNENLSDLFPFKLFNKENVSEKEQELREKLIEKVKKKPSYFVENGVKKLVVPLEAVVFLNNDLNPLVNEYGEIILRIEENKIANLTGYKIVLEDTGEILFENDENIKESLKELDRLTKEQSISIEEINEMIKNKIKNRIEEEEKTIEEENLNNMNKTLGLSDKKKDEEEEISSNISSDEIISEDDLLDLVGDDFEDEIEEVKDVISIDSLMETIDSEDDLFETEDEDINKKESESVIELIRKKEWQEIEGIQFTPKDWDAFFKNNFSTNENKIKFFTNIIKHKNNVFNDNKTNLYIDIMIIYSSISKLFGNDADIIMKKFAKMPNNIRKSFESNFIHYFNDDLNGTFSKKYIKEDSNCFYSYGILIILESIKEVFKDDEEFDFFRSYKTNNYKLISKSDNCNTKFISSIDNLIL